jgi:hypothetical protein
MHIILGTFAAALTTAQTVPRFKSSEYVVAGKIPTLLLMKFILIDK